MASHYPYVFHNGIDNEPGPDNQRLDLDKAQQMLGAINKLAAALEVAAERKTAAIRSALDKWRAEIGTTLERHNLQLDCSTIFAYRDDALDPKALQELNSLRSQARALHRTSHPALSTENKRLKDKLQDLEKRLSKSERDLKEHKLKIYRMQLVGPHYDSYAQTILGVQAKYEKEILELKAQCQAVIDDLDRQHQMQVNDLNMSHRSATKNFSGAIHGLDVVNDQVLRENNELKAKLLAAEQQLQSKAFPAAALAQIEWYSLQAAGLGRQLSSCEAELAALKFEHRQVQDRNLQLCQDVSGLQQQIQTMEQEQKAQVQGLEQKFRIEKDIQAEDNDDALVSEQGSLRLRCRRCKDRHSCDGKAPCDNCKAAGLSCWFEICFSFANNRICSKGSKCHRVHDENDLYEQYPVQPNPTPTPQ